jgi:hypothetical protein
MEQVSVHVRPDVARALQGREAATEISEEILQEASRLGVSLEPVHPGTSAPDLLTHFAVYVEDAERPARSPRRFSAATRSRAPT